ncbi:hypothetical protein K492DRAFT_179894 [Lichtheimia hyalospora FSU 10163]|nr:hypothetical protein K492DRAFT_179894 [Lichtheimia hyalospora FSU 10163]
MTNVLSNFSQQPIVTISSGTWANVIADSTRCVQRCVQEQLGYLDNRARALATCAHFEAALEDATTMQQLDPSSATGYLCAGHVYSMQGRQKAAIEIYDKGLAVVPLSDPSYQQLLDAQSMAQDKDSRCIDFIKKLPLDIIQNIASRILSKKTMTPRKIRPYLEVSREWRETLLLGVQKLHIESTTKDDLGDDETLLEQVAPYCTALTIHDHTTSFLHLNSKAYFHSLRNVVLHARWDSEDFTQDPKETLASLSSLTHLTISIYNNITLADVLNSCPHLVYLKASNIGDDDMSTAPECHPRLKTLVLSSYRDGLDIHGITKRLPALQVFSAYPFEESNDLKVVQDNCPNLKMIGCNDQENWYDRVPYITSNDQDPNDTIGVHTLYVDYDETNMPDFKVKGVIHFLIRNRHTLQDIYFWSPLGCSDTKEDDPSNTPILSHAIQATTYNNHDDRFDQMTSYSQYIYHQNCMLMARWVARKSPHLKKVELEESYHISVNIEIDIGAFFDDLIGLCDLETLKVSLNLDVSMDMGSIERFIQYHSTFDSQLHTLILPKNTRLSMDALDVLATLPRLQTLSISLPLVQDEDPDGEHISGFIHKLAQGCPQLTHLEIRTDGPIHDSIFLQLSELHVTTLELGMGFYEDKLPLGLLSLTQCPNLKVLHIDDLYHHYPYEATAKLNLSDWCA